MQTAKQVEKRIRSLLSENKIRQNLIDVALHLYNSGAIDPTTHEDDYSLPKMLLSEALRREAHHYIPFHDNGRKTMKNLRHF